MTKLCIIGSGAILNWYLEALARIPNCMLVALASPRSGKSYAEKLQVRYYTDYRELLLREKAADGIINLLPNHLHAESCSYAIDEGYRFIFCEKPMGNRLNDTYQLMKKIETSGTVYQIGYMKRYNPGFIKIKDALSTLGEIEFVRSCMFESGAAGVISPRDASSPWKTNPILSGGGHLTHAGSHHIDLMRFYFGEMETVSCKLRRDTPEAPEYYANVRMGMNSGVDIDMQIGRVNIPNLGPEWQIFEGGWNEYIEIVAENGYIRVDNPSWEGLKPIKVSNWFKGMEGPSSAFYSCSDQWLYELQSFVSCCETGELDKDAPNQRDGYLVDYIVSQMRESAENNGATVSLVPIE